RIARIVTGRGRVTKMAAGFDGWLDDVAFGTVGTAEAAFHDQHRPRNDKTALLRFNDFTDVERLFEDSDDIAAVLYEPMLANAACLMPLPGYLEHVQAVARRHGALLIADEVLMGFRIHNGLTSHHYGLDPDLVTVGKAVASGIAAAAIAGKPAVLDEYVARNGVRGGTFSGNPVACAAIEATLARLACADYPALLAKGDALRTAIQQVFARAGVDVSTSGHGSVFSLWFAAAPPASYEVARTLADADRMKALHLALRRHGVIVMPSPWGRIYVSFAHDEEALDILRDAFGRAAAAL
ncbi:MAG: aminotransferase class III-fold pyridoxal phosphate-dependent enzyme, partial [Janthinobacterium lividum]